MADTVPVACAKGVWTEIVAGPRTDCLITPTRSGYFQYSELQPDDTSGHFLFEDENHNAVPETDQSFWFMCPFSDCRVWKSDRPAA